MSVEPTAASDRAGAGEAAAPAPARLHRAWLRRRGDGDPLVMVHGFGGDLNGWRVLVAAAALPRPVLAIDLPGHGRSPGGGVATFAALVEAVAAAIAEEGVTAAHLVGHSLGAAIAAGIATSGRFAVRSLFLLAPAGLGAEINGDFLSGFCRADTEAELAAAMGLLVADPASIPPVFVEVTAASRAEPGVRDAQARIVEGVFPGGRQAFSIRQHLETAQVPVTVVFGETDRIIPVAHMAGLPTAIFRHRLSGIGHMPQIEARDEVSQFLVAHLAAAG